MFGKLVGGALIVAGTALGVGVLAVPMFMSQGGGVTLVAFYFIAWLFSMFTGLALLEVLTWMKERDRANLMSMARLTLGSFCRNALFVTYLFFFYSLLIAYFCEGGSMLFRLTECYAEAPSIIRHLGPLFFALFICPILLRSTRDVDYLNRALVWGVFVTLVGVYFIGRPSLEKIPLWRFQWREALGGLPVLLLAFGFHTTVPTIYYYLDKNIRDVRRAIIFGSFLSLLIYLAWGGIILGIVPFGTLFQSYVTGNSVIHSLNVYTSCSSLYFLGELFVFFAIVSSLIGVGISIVDFFSDAFKWEKRRHRFSLFAISFLVPLAWAICYPALVLRFLRCIGGIGVLALSGIFPLMMLWRGRYTLRLEAKERVVPGGRIFLTILIAFILVDLICLYCGF